MPANKIRVNKNTLKMLKCVASSNEGRPILENLLVKDGIMFVADGFQLLAQRTDCDGEFAIPPRLIKAAGMPEPKNDSPAEMERAESIVVTIGNNAIVAKGENTVVGTRTMFPAAPPSGLGIANMWQQPLVEFAVSVRLMKKVLSGLPEDYTMYFRLRRWDRTKSEKYPHAIEFSASPSGGHRELVPDPAEVVDGLIMPMFWTGEYNITFLSDYANKVKGKPEKQVGSDEPAANSIVYHQNGDMLREYIEKPKGQQWTIPDVGKFYIMIERPNGKFEAFKPEMIPEPESANLPKEEANDNRTQVQP